MLDIEKSFGNNKVLDKARIDIVPGEVHAFMGENGAGKSTLMNILTGVHKKDAGKILINDVETEFSNPKEAEKNGISFIYQELNVLPDMTIEENLFLNKEITKKFGFVDKKAMREKSKEVLKSLGVNIDPNTVMSNLSVGEQQMVEICKALMTNAKVIIMDEPTSALTDAETRRLFEVISNLRANKVSIIYISHRMEEIFEISNRITVQRDGQYIGTKNTTDTTEDELVKMMIGRELKERYPLRNNEIGEVLFEVSNLSVENVINNISFTVRAGEILGFSGLMGSGRSEIMYALFGDVAKSSGVIKINGKEVNIKSPKDAMDHGIGFITEDRKNEGLLLNKSIKENITLSNFNSLSSNGFIKSEMEKQAAENSNKMFNVKTQSINTETGNLSGGNQQKVVIAKWVLTDPKVLILDEPTRGVDVGAKKEIYNIINDLSKKGIAIIIVSSDLPEVIGMSDRIAVMHEGKLQGILDKEDATQENIMTLATGGDIYGNDKKDIK
nr:sugar ABC transporter ATP-binding protein [Bacillus sp. FJAT-50079]